MYFVSFSCIFHSIYLKNERRENMDNDQNYGYLVVNASTASDAIPIVGAVVTVSQLTDGRDVPFVILQTDVDGRTDKIQLPTPPPGNSLTPNPTGPSYALYNIEITKDGYYSSNSLNVPVFAGVTSIQPIRLIPVISGYTLQGDRVIPNVTEGQSYELAENEYRGEVK